MHVPNLRARPGPSGSLTPPLAQASATSIGSVALLAGPSPRPQCDVKCCCSSSAEFLAAMADISCGSTPHEVVSGRLQALLQIMRKGSLPGTAYAAV